MWNFHSGLLLNTIQIIDRHLYSICLWDNNYLFSGCSDKTIKLIKLNNGLIINTLDSHDNKVITVKRKINPKY